MTNLNPAYGTDLSGLPSGGPSCYSRIKAERLARAERLEQEARGCAATDPKRAASLRNKAHNERAGYGFTF